MEELTAILKGLRLAIDMGLDELVCVSYSQLSVKLITGDVSKFLSYVVLIQDIKDVIASATTLSNIRLERVTNVLIT